MATTRPSSSDGRLKDLLAGDLESTIRKLIEAGAKPKSPDEVAREEALRALDALGKSQVGDEAVLFEGTRFVLPEAFGGNLTEAIVFLQALQGAEETEFSINRDYPYRPWDGAAAWERAMKRVFATAAVGKATYSLFGKQPPQYHTIPVGVSATLQVPWGEFEFSPLKAVFHLGSVRSEDGQKFFLSVTAPRKFRRRIEGFLTVVEDELRTGSIYRGQAIDAGESPGFVDLSVDPAKVVYTRDVLRQLEANLWSVLTYADELRAQGQSLKRAVLLEGPWGSGKSLAGALTAQHAVTHGWTFIRVRPGTDNPYDALKTAKLYAPSVVHIEDLDTLLAGKDRNEVSKMLDALDNATNKGAEVICVFTTNFAEVLEKGVLRPGRIDATIHVGDLDEEAQVRLVKAVVPGQMLAADIDWPAVAKAFGGFLPSFGVEAAGRALRYSMVRGKGVPQPITTQDLVEAAADLKPQLNMLEAASSTRHQKDSMGTVFQRAFAEVLNRTTVDDMEVKVDKT